MRTALVLGMAAGLAMAGDAPWESEPMTADAARVLQAASQVEAPAREEAIVLLQEARYAFDADGKYKVRFRYVYRVLSPRGIERWSSIEWPWAPWHEKRPEIRARVVTAGGQEHRLEAGAVSEVPAVPESQQLYSDSKLLRAHLSAVGVGSVVELEVSIEESQPAFASGAVRSLSFGDDVPVERSRLVVEAPAALPLAYRARLLPGVEPRREADGDRQRVTFEAGPLPPHAEPEPFLPSDVPRVPRVTFATGASWNAVARGYERLVEERLAQASVKDAAKEAVAGVKAPRDRIQRLLSRLAEVRYTGVELGAAAIVPASPETTLSRRYGDCKDKATLLVALLRAVGIEARVALLRAGFGEDVEVEAPGMGGFNHAIVMVKDPALWIDATDEHAVVGHLPSADQGRLALVAAADTAALVRTPELPAAEERVVEVREVVLADSGPGRVVQSLELHGTLASTYRHGVAEEGEEALRGLVDALKDELGAASVSRPTASADPVPAPFRCRIEATGARGTDTAKGEAAAEAHVASMLDWLPDGVMGDPRAPDRRHDLMAGTARRVERRYLVSAPRGYEPAPVPRPATWAAGPLTYEEAWAVTPDGKVEGTIVMDLPKRRLTPSEVTTLRKEVVARLEARRAVVRFRDPRAAR